MANIFARNPYVVTINEAGQVETKIELRLWNGTGAAPTAPQYILSKLIPASNAPTTYYDLSPYIKEFIEHNTIQSQPSSVAATPTAQWCNVQIKKFKRVTTTFTQVGTTETHKAFEGYGYFEEGYNPQLSEVLISPLTYYYPSGSNAGWVTVSTGTGYTARYTSPSGSIVNQSLAGFPNRVIDVRRVNTNFTLVGNKLEILDGSANVLWTGYFYPKDECKYTPVQIDFVNKYGAWQREWFFKASYNTLNVENKEYNMLPSTYPNYSQTEGQRAVFNANGKKTIRVNTDWVEESYSEIIRQMMLSQKILIDAKPAKINTKNTELFKSINTHMINYQLEFEFAYDVINSVM